MPTNKERRDVAARLRDIDAKTWHTTWHELCAMKNACGCYVGQDQHDVELKDRLADLIEPEPVCLANITITDDQVDKIKSDILKELELPERTCTFSVYQTGDDHYPTCSACGYEAAREECEDYVGVVYYEKRHCPNCGAKVV